MDKATTLGLIVGGPILVWIGSQMYPTIIQFLTVQLGRAINMVDRR
jgi:hypothetical protein